PPGASQNNKQGSSLRQTHRKIKRSQRGMAAGGEGVFGGTKVHSNAEQGVVEEVAEFFGERSGDATG
ncbi:MAG TPA: hypothetical protein VGN42_01105, partial [Pirellulales bacterium]|nr:hypothetical protein [Pirellulales bacterium]